MKFPIFGGVFSPQNMVRVKGGGVLKYAGGLMGVDYGEASMEGGRASLSTCLLLRVKALISTFGMIGGLGMIL